MTEPETEFLSASFRDPDGFVIESSNRIFRRVHAHGADAFRLLLDSPGLAPFRDAGRLVATTRSSNEEVQDVLGNLPLGLGEGEWWSHPRVFFPTYPWEWTSGMLWAAASLTLDLAEAALADGLILKDASAENVLFENGLPLFVDALSFRPLRSGASIWRAQAQFEQQFLIPLVLSRTTGMGVHRWYYAYPKGVPPEEAARLLPTFARFWGPGLRYCVLPSLFGKLCTRLPEGFLYTERLGIPDERARYALGHSLHGLRKALNSLKPTSSRASHWSHYAETGCNYPVEEQRAKEAFLKDVLQHVQPTTVLDLGSNTGQFSRMAAAQGARVVAVDSDSSALEISEGKSLAGSMGITHLIMDLANPTPASGWQNTERSSFLGRAAGRFDMILALALLHHLLVTERIPRATVITWMRGFGAAHWVVEWTLPQDSNFKRLVRGREELYTNLTREAFEAEVLIGFEIREKREIMGGGRWLYWLNPRIS